MLAIRHLTLAYRLRSQCVAFLTLFSFAISDVALYAQAEPHDAPAYPVSISGALMDGDGARLRSGTVDLYRFVTNDTKWGRWVFHSRVSTNSDGFAFRDLSDDLFLVSARTSGFARAFCSVRCERGTTRKVNIVLRPPSSPIISLQDVNGKPIVGGRVRSFAQRGVNGECRLGSVSISSLGIQILPSDDAGRICLPELAIGDFADNIIIDHPDYAPICIDSIAVTPNSVTKAIMTKGVSVSLQIDDDVPAGTAVTSAAIDLRHEPFHHPSTHVHEDIAFDGGGRALLTLAPGNYSMLRLEHHAYYLSRIRDLDKPRPPHPFEDGIQLRPGCNEVIRFKSHRKVLVQGRLVDAASKAPLPSIFVYGDIFTSSVSGQASASPEDDWHFAAFGKTDGAGVFALPLAQGLARLSLDEALISESGYLNVTVDEIDGQRIPDIYVRPIPKFKGTVRTPAGTAAKDIIVCLRGKTLQTQPVLTDQSGRFEIRPDHIAPREPQRLRLIAFDPHKLLSCQADVNRNTSEDIALTLMPHEAEWPLTICSDLFHEWERGQLSAPQGDSVISLKGEEPPPLDGVAWINTGGRQLSLRDLRGHYVLLMFWFSGCGPCHQDLPSVKLLERVYRDDGLIVIGIHDNSSAPNDVREHISKIGVSFPVVVDHADGRMIARFMEHGIPKGYPCYVLIDPNGDVILDDRTIPHPTLRSYKIEIVRSRLLNMPMRTLGINIPD